MNYIYTASDTSGQKQKGRLEANDQKEVIEYLRAKHLIPIEVKTVQEKSYSIVEYFSRVRSGEVVLFTRQLSSMITTGLTVIESMNILKQQENSKQMQKIINEVIANLSEGASLSQALSNYPNVFSRTYVALIKSAEEGGILDKVLDRLAHNLEKSEDIKKKVKSALFYPAIVMAGVAAVLLLMNVFIIPQMATLYESLDLELPLMTRVVLFGSKVTTTLLPFSIFFVIAGIIAYTRFIKTPTGMRFVDNLRLKLPVFSHITRLSILSEISRTISLLLSSGGSLISALNIASEVAGNYRYKKAVDDATALVEKGAGLSIALRNQDVFPPLMVQLVKVGESTGKVDESLLKVSEYFERDLEIRVKTLTTAIEPILIIVLGVSVAFLIISVITPIYSLVSQIN